MPMIRIMMMMNTCKRNMCSFYAISFAPTIALFFLYCLSDFVRAWICSQSPHFNRSLMYWKIKFYDYSSIFLHLLYNKFAWIFIERIITLWNRCLSQPSFDFIFFFVMIWSFLFSKSAAFSSLSSRQLTSSESARVPYHTTRILCMSIAHFHWEIDILKCIFFCMLFSKILFLRAYNCEWSLISFSIKNRSNSHWNHHYSKFKLTAAS